MRHQKVVRGKGIGLRINQPGLICELENYVQRPFSLRHRGKCRNVRLKKGRPAKVMGGRGGGGGYQLGGSEWGGGDA